MNDINIPRHSLENISEEQKNFDLNNFRKTIKSLIVFREPISSLVKDVSK